MGEHLPFEKMDCKTEIRDAIFSVSKEPQCGSFLSLASGYADS